MSVSIPIRVKRLSDRAVMPAPMSVGAAGADVCACLEFALTLQPGARALVPTGLSVEIPEGFEIQVRPRSGLAAKHGITVLNSPGTIDSDYRGEVKVILVNLGSEPYLIQSGDRIAQWVVSAVPSAEWHSVDALGETIRGTQGFGSTGTTQALT